MKHALAALSLAFILGLSPKAEASTAFELSLGPIGSGSASGTITTDDTIGNLAAGNILDWNIVVAPSFTSSFTLTPGNSTLNIVDSGFSATATGLFFDFGRNNNKVSITSNSAPNYFLCLTGKFTCGGPDNTAAIAIGTAGGADYSVGSGVTQIGTVAPVPEPSAVGLLGLGLIGLGAAARRRLRS